MILLFQILGCIVFLRNGIVAAVASTGSPRLFHRSQRRTLSINSRAILNRNSAIEDTDASGRQNLEVLSSPEFGETVGMEDFNHMSAVGKEEIPDMNVTEQLENASNSSDDDVNQANSTADTSINNLANATVGTNTNSSQKKSTKSGIEDLEAMYPYLNVTHKVEDRSAIHKKGMIGFPYLDVGAGTGHAYLMQSPGSTVVSRDDRCDAAQEECTWLYSETDFKLRVQSYDVCGGIENSNNFSCCLHHADDPSVPAGRTVSMAECAECSGTSCEWCMTSFENGHHVIHPKVGDTCIDCHACQCLGAVKSGGEVEVSIQAIGGDSECNMMWTDVS